MDDVAALLYEGIVSSVRRARKEAKARAALAGAPAPSVRGVAPSPWPIASVAAVTKPVAQTVMPRPALVLPPEAIMLDLEPLVPAGPRRDRTGTTGRAVLDALGSPGTAASGIVIAEILGPPLSLRPRAPVVS